MRKNARLIAALVVLAAIALAVYWHQSPPRPIGPDGIDPATGCFVVREGTVPDEICNRPGTPYGAQPPPK